MPVGLRVITLRAEVSLTGAEFLLGNFGQLVKDAELELQLHTVDSGPRMSESLREQIHTSQDLPCIELESRSVQ